MISGTPSLIGDRHDPFTGCMHAHGLVLVVTEARSVPNFVFKVFFKNGGKRQELIRLRKRKRSQSLGSLSQLSNLLRSASKLRSNNDTPHVTTPL